ncbi:Hypothetical_protein [Hexamita inflata]|uniref:Hypothetical_protein n=1 Tax=Hexamita inflata TaxID=28002 RepID=A0AA86RG29_9EUKA|nr:Hypothetical protein HINF_LOCUS64971 [Hexamita inflata]
MLNNIKSLALPRGISYQAVHPAQLTGRNTNSQPKLKSCLSIQLGIGCVKPIKQKQQESYQMQEIPKQSEVWNQLISDDSEFELDSTNIADVFAKFNQFNDFLPLGNMIRQNIDGLKFKCGRLDDLLVLGSSHQASMDNLISKQIQIISKCKI